MNQFHIPPSRLVMVTLWICNREVLITKLGRDDQANAGLVPLLGHCFYLPNPSRFIIRQPFYHSSLHNVGTAL
jgi:hypothetical protein